jgi:hypothetical protein
MQVNATADCDTVSGCGTDKAIAGFEVLLTIELTGNSHVSVFPDIFFRMTPNEVEELTTRRRNEYNSY